MRKKGRGIYRPKDGGGDLKSRTLECKDASLNSRKRSNPDKETLPPGLL